MFEIVAFSLLAVLLAVALAVIFLLRGELNRRIDSFSSVQKDEAEDMRRDLKESLGSFRETIELNGRLSRELISDKLERIEKSSEAMRSNVGEKLETIRATVDEKLEKTLSERLGKSFETVGKQLVEVQKGLGEMQTLAQDVGGLKKVLSNVKMRGGFGEVQLSMLLEQILAPEQYEANVHPKPRSSAVVEYAVKLPGKDDSLPQIWLPIDAKFPKESYEKLQDAYDAGDGQAVEDYRKALYSDIRKMAQDISGKYIAPPYTTDFAIMFLPFEGIYSEAVRSATFLQEIQGQYKVMITGPTTLAALLNSLQVGFRTLAIEKRSSEVWQVLGNVKSEFAKFGDLLVKAKGKIQSGLNDIDQLEGVRTRQIQAKLRNVTSDEEETQTRRLEAEND